MDSSYFTTLRNAKIALGSTSQILALFAHRNKNQHRRSTWWSSLNLLRRHIAKLIPEVDAAETVLKRSVSATASRKRKRKTNLSSPGVQDDNLSREDEVEEVKALHTRIAWLRSKLVPKAYHAFTQLTADNQFAHLGLMLLGVVAQVDAAIAPLEPASETPQHEGDDLVKRGRVEVPDRNHKAPDVELAHGAIEEDVDLGIAVPREEDFPDDSRPENETANHRTISEASHDESMSVKQLIKPKRKKKRKGGDEFDDLFSGLL